jgi:hypothetical protein
MYGREYIYYDDATGGYELRRWATLPTIEAADE